jgi:hypothetical protein
MEEMKKVPGAWIAECALQRLVGEAGRLEVARMDGRVSLAEYGRRSAELALRDMEIRASPEGRAWKRFCDLYGRRLRRDV